MRYFYRLCLTVLSLLAGLAGTLMYFIAYPHLPAWQAPEHTRYLPQWSAEQRALYYFTPQGTQVKGLHYDWFTQLEMPFSGERFSAPANMGRFGFLIDPPTPANPDQLPIGFTAHPAPGHATRYLDITCAACHTGELRFNGTALRIDGGPAQHVLPSSVPTLRGGAFGQALVASLAATYYLPWKFERFAHRVLGERYATERVQLREALKASLDSFVGVAWNDTHRGLYPTQEGPGRADAFGRIANATFGDAITPANYRVANAPVDYPQLWDIWTFDWVQWNGSARQPMARNIGESLGVGATLALFDPHGEPLRGAARYPSSVRIFDLQRIEQTLQQLKPPTWPEDLLGNIDVPLARRGRALFEQHCATCHRPPVARDGGRPMQALKLLPVEYIGTDPTAASNIADYRYDLSSLQWDPAELAGLGVQLPVGDAAVDLQQLSSAKGLAYITAFVARRAYQEAGIDAQQRPELDGFGLPIGVREERAYKARPLDGAWATAPFLHNGSVPNLYQLLSPQDERPRTFYRGTFEYDPAHVGYRTEAFPGGFLYDTALVGNHNSGHEFREGPRGQGVIGPLLQPQERWALIEYLKVLGGPLEAKLQ